MSRRALFLLISLAAARVEAAFSVEGTVFADRDGNGLFSAGDEALPGIMVSFEGSLATRTDASGRYTLSVPLPGLVWARTPDGYVPGAAWRPVAAAGVADIPLRPQEVTGPLRFVHASDSHIGSGVPLADVEVSFREASSVEPRPHFLVVTGDITSGNTDPQFRDLMQIVGGMDVPFVPVIGNHDAYDGGVNYRKYLGPQQYSFDQGGARFVVLDFGANIDGVLAFVRRELADLPAGMPVVAFSHAPYESPISARLAEAGIDYLFTGHWHSNRIIEHPGMQEVNTETVVFGGIDVTPAGYRIAEWNGSRFVYSHHTIVDTPVLEIVYPGDGCVPAGPVDVIVAAETGAPLSGLSLAVGGGAAVPLSPRGGWTYGATVTVDGSGSGEAMLVASVAGGATTSRRVCVRPRPAAPAIGEWPQLGGGAQHQGRADGRIAPPLVHAWARTVGGHLRGGSVVVGGGRVFAPVVDLGPGTTGGVVAFDAATGAQLWEKRVGYAVHSAPALFEDLVIFGASNGVVHAVRAADGGDVWTYDVGDGLSVNTSWLYAAPTVADGSVFIGVNKRFAAVDARTGRELWQRDPGPSGVWLGSYSSAGVGGGLVVAGFNRGVDGIIAWDAVTGDEVWRVPSPLSKGINASAVVDGDTIYLANSETVAFALDMAPAPPRWANWAKKISDGDDWRYAVVATPALAGGKLMVPTLTGLLVAFDAASGVELWRHMAKPGTIRPAHYEGSGVEAFAGSPAVAGDLVWIGGTDGRLSALDLVSGDEVWGVDLGAPILTGPAPAGEMLFVGTYDGTLHALRNDPGFLCPNAPGCVDPPPDDDGCTIAVGGAGGRGRGLAWSVAMVVAATGLRRRRRR